MRKRRMTSSSRAGAPRNESWLDLNSAAVVEVTSEDKEYLIESALVSDETRDWRAADSGTQTVRLLRSFPTSRTHCARLRRNGYRAYPRVRLAMVS